MYSHCRNWCTMEDRCTSINMVLRKKDKMICQLSDSDQLQHPNDLKPTAGLIYWFRFQGDAGTKMPTTCQPMLRCDAYKTGWLRGTHPSVAEGAVNKTVCFRYHSCCKYSVIIRVRNCGSYYVYHLINTPKCYATVERIEKD